MSQSMSGQAEPTTISRPGGAVAYEVAGEGPLILCVPGMGDMRSSYRFVAPMLVSAGYRVALMDLRGHGDSDAGFDTYGDEPTAGDVAALVAELGAPAVVIGNSMAAGSAVLVAAQQPELISGLVLVGPFVREPGTSGLMRLIGRAAMAPLWAATSWNSYLPKLYAGRKPDDFPQYRAAVAASLKKHGHAKAFSITTRTRHDAAAGALGSVKAPVLVIMGELDPDFPKPGVEASWIAEQVGGTVLMVAEAGHYPQAQRPELVAPAIEAFANQVFRHA